MIKKAVKKAKALLSEKNKRYARAVAKESLAEGRKLSEMALKELKRELPKARKILTHEARAFAKKIKKIKR